MMSVKRVTRFCTESSTSHMGTPSVLDKSGNLVMLRGRKKERACAHGVEWRGALNVDITMEKWERELTRNAELLTSTGTEMELGTMGSALCMAV